MDNGGLSAADVALLNGDGMNGGWGGMIWLFAILAMMGGGFGFGGNNQQYATRDQVQNGFDTQNLAAQTRDILAAVNAGTAQAVAATNQVYHDITGYVGDKYSELQRDVAGLAVGQANMLANQNQCCCNLQRAIDGVNYNTAMQTAQINENITAMGQKLYDLIQNNKMEAMQNRINQLELQNQLAGVVRYPNGFVYNAGQSPFCGCNCN